MLYHTEVNSGISIITGPEGQSTGQLKLAYLFKKVLWLGFPKINCKWGQGMQLKKSINKNTFLNF